MWMWAVQGASLSSIFCGGHGSGSPDRLVGCQIKLRSLFVSPKRSHLTGSPKTWQGIEWKRGCEGGWTGVSVSFVLSELSAYPQLSWQMVYTWWSLFFDESIIWWDGMRLLLCNSIVTFNSFFLLSRGEKTDPCIWIRCEGSGLTISQDWQLIKSTERKLVTRVLISDF